MELLKDFYLAKPINKFWLVLFAWMFWPDLMFVVGIVFESRIVPIFEHQSLIFMPGDLMLGVMFVAMIGICAYTEIPDDWKGSTLARWWWVCVICLGIVWAIWTRGSDVVNYPRASAMSPTKIAHDVIGYLVTPITLVGLGVPHAFFAVTRGSKRGSEVRLWHCWVVLIVAFYLFIGCVIADWIRGCSAEDILARHPADWKPIWE